jgi:hypothetical protein
MAEEEIESTTISIGDEHVFAAEPEPDNRKPKLIA